MNNEYSAFVNDVAVIELVAKYFDAVDREDGDDDHYVQDQLRRIARRIETLGESW